MKKMAIVLVASLTLIGSLAEICLSDPTPKAPPIIYDNRVDFCYFASNANWWTGLAILNVTGSTNDVRISLYNTAGIEVAWGTHALDAGELLVGTLDTLIESGTIPERGSITIEASYGFMVDKFTGNLSTGGFSEMEKSSEMMMLL